jgi:hypothetical protein
MPDATTIRQIELQLYKAEQGLGMPYDAERVAQLRSMLREARKQKLSQGLARPPRDFFRPRRDFAKLPVQEIGRRTEPAEDRLLDVGALAHQAAAFDMPNTRTRPVRRACMRDFLSSCCARPTADKASIEASAARMMLQISACSCSGGTGITI